MAAYNFSNNAQTTLASICNIGDSSISVVSATGFPTATPYSILIDTELLLVTSGASTTTWGVSRAQEGTAAATHAASATVTQLVTLAGLNSLNQAYYPYWGVSGLTGASLASRYVGATGAAPPGSGTFAVGDFVVIQSGGIGVCIGAGTPGTWVTIAPQNFSTSFATHVISTAPGPPTTSALNPALSSATLAANSTDQKGTVIAVTGGTPVNQGSTICQVNFASAYPNAHYGVVVTQSTAIGTAFVPQVFNKLTTGFGIWACGSNMAASNTFAIDYVVIG
jgi:hypothetical protein